MDDLPVPQGSWQEAYNSRQRKYNMHLIAGISFFGLTFGIVSLLSYYLIIVIIS
jgi:hypothetical protein